MYPDIATRDFAIGEKVSRSDLKTIFILRFEVKKGDQLRVQGEVCELQGEVEYLKVQLKRPNTNTRNLADWSLPPQISGISSESYQTIINH